LDGEELGEHDPVALDAADGVLDLPQGGRPFDALVHGVLSSNLESRFPDP
jgi:hypothetical protein